jgi:hypothetical protein
MRCLSYPSTSCHRRRYEVSVIGGGMRCLSYPSTSCRRYEELRRYEECVCVCVCGVGGMRSYGGMRSCRRYEEL